MPQTIRWGIAGCGRIAGRMARALNALPGATIAAAASQYRGNRAFAAEHHVGTMYGTYEELAAAPDVDAVYVATIHPTHYEIVRACLEAGKAVLCEKPLAMTAAEAEGMFRLAEERDVLLVEAMWTRFLPAWKAVRRAAAEGAVGELLVVEADFLPWMEYDPASRLFDKALGAGAALDLGIYCIHAALSLLGTEYETLSAAGRTLPDGVDTYAAMTLTYPGGKIARLSCGADVRGVTSATLYGTEGRIAVEEFVGARRYTLHRGGQSETRDFEDIEGFTYQAQAFMEALRRGDRRCDEVPPGDSLCAARIIDEVHRALGRGV